MPPDTATATQVWTKRAKKGPLDPSYDGPYDIVERLGDSSLRIKVGEYADGRDRTEVRHWSSCYPMKPDSHLESTTRPALGRKPLDPKASEFRPNQEMTTRILPQRQCRLRNGPNVYAQ